MKKIKILFSICLIIFIGLLLMMLFNPAPVQSIDDALRQIINAHRSVVWNIFFVNFTQLFNSKETIIWIVITVILSGIMVNRRFVWQVLLTIGSGVLLNRIIKLLIQRPRPNTNLLMHYSSYSFPSGHSSAAALILGCLILLTWQVVRRNWVKVTITTILVTCLLYTSPSPRDS